MRSLFGFVALAIASCASHRSPPIDTSPATLSTVRATSFGARVGKGLALTTLDLEVTAARCAYRVAAHDAPNVAMTIRSARCEAPRSVVEGSATVISGTEAGVEVVVDASENVVEDFRVLAVAERRELAVDLEVSDAIASVRVREARVEALDRDGVVVLSSAPIVASDARGAAVPVEPVISALESHRYRLTLRVDGENATAPIVIDPAWSTAPSLGSARMLHHSVLLKSGKVLVVGGETMSGGTLVGVTAVELFDPTTKTWRRVGTLRNALLGGFSVSTLPDGDVLIVGGETAVNVSVATVERFRTTDERMATAAEVANLPAPRARHGAVALGDGKVLVFGGTNAGTLSANTYAYDPAANTWSARPSMAFARGGHAYVRLSGGDVLAAGGRRYAMGETTSDVAELYDASSGTWSSGAVLAMARAGGTFAPLPANKALYYGGQPYLSFGAPIPGTMIFDRATKSWSDGGTPPKAHDQAPYTVLPDASLLIVGGRSNFSGFGNEIASVFDPAKIDPTDPNKAWSRAFLPFARVYHTLTQLSSGNAFLVGGSTGGSLGTALFNPMLYVSSSKRWLDLGDKRTVRRSHTATELADGRVLVVGGSDTSGNALALTEIYGVSLGAACASEKDCPSGFCVDGVCCDTACDQPCAACNVMSKAGTCSPVTGPPVGGRECAGPIPLNPCAVPACDGKTTASCAGFAADATRVCIPGRCEGDILVGAAKCDGAGKCVRSDETSCAPFSCRDGACVSTCTTASDCSGGAACDAGKCVARAQCTDDKLGFYGPDGKIRSCGAFRCGPDGACIDTCSASDVCAPGFVCDTNQRTCTGPSAAPADDGGCTYGRRQASAAWVAMLAIALILRKRGGAR